MRKEWPFIDLREGIKIGLSMRSFPVCLDNPNFYKPFFFKHVNPVRDRLKCWKHSWLISNFLVLSESYSMFYLVIIDASMNDEIDTLMSIVVGRGVLVALFEWMLGVPSDLAHWLFSMIIFCCLFFSKFYRKI